MATKVADHPTDATSVAVRLVAVGAPRNSEAWRRAEAATPLVVARWRVRRAVRCGVAALCRAAATEGCAAFLDELGTARGVDLITPVSAKRHDGIVHRAAREGRAECARVLARRGARGYTCCATATRRRCSPRRPRCSPPSAQPTTRSLDESAGDNWLRCFRSTARIHSTARQRDLLDACELYVENGAEGRLPPKTKIRRAAARLEPYRATLEAPADADALARARFAKVCFAAMCAAARAGRAAVVAALVDEFSCDPTGRGFPSSPLHAAVQAPSTVCCRFLLDRVGGDATRTDARGVCVLRAAGRANKPETLALLCRHAALRSTVRGANGATALQAAAFSGFGGGSSC